MYISRISYLYLTWIYVYAAYIYIPVYITYIIHKPY